MSDRETSGIFSKAVEYIRDISVLDVISNHPFLKAAEYITDDNTVSDYVVSKVPENIGGITVGDIISSNILFQAGKHIGNIKVDINVLDQHPLFQSAEYIGNTIRQEIREISDQRREITSLITALNQRRDNEDFGLSYNPMTVPILSETRENGEVVIVDPLGRVLGDNVEAVTIYPSMEDAVAAYEDGRHNRGAHITPITELHTDLEILSARHTNFTSEDIARFRREDELANALSINYPESQYKQWQNTVSALQGRITVNKILLRNFNQAQLELESKSESSDHEITISPKL